MIRYLLLPYVLFISTMLPIYGQTIACTSTCNAGRGENIFPDGDFGTGIAPLLGTDPGLAPGYQFGGFNAPPSDGFYVITNNTTNWGSFASTAWINIKDNSNNQQGYMMVVNAAFTPGIFYEKQVGVCANTLYEMSVDVISMIEPSLAATHIKSNVAFGIDGQTVCSTGDIPHDATWKTFRFSFTTGPTTQSVNLTFFNNAPGGIGNDLAIDNIAFRACGPVLALPDTVEYCLGTPVTLQVDPQNSPYTTPNYLWQFRTNPTAAWQNVPNSNQNNLNVGQPQTGYEYRVVMANSAFNLNLPNCRVISPFSQLQLDDLSQLAIGGPDTIVCNGAPAILEVGNFKTYQWSDGSTSPSISAPDPGLYAVTVTTENDCVGKDSLVVYEVNLSAAATATDPICFGDSTGVIVISDRMGGTGSLTYAVDADWPKETDPILSGVPAGSYSVQVTDSLGCLYEIPIQINDPVQLQVDAGLDRTIFACEPTTLTALTNDPDVQYIWQPADSLSCADCPNPVAMPNLSQDYIITVISPERCIAIDTVRLNTTPRLDVYVPNVFIVDGPRESAFFTVSTSKSARMVKEFRVYDRWGGLQFSRTNTPPGSPNLRWNGYTPRDEPAPEGVYVWLALIEFTDGIVREFSGDVLLMKGQE
jgi:hypothetical protein